MKMKSLFSPTKHNQQLPNRQMSEEIKNIEQEEPSFLKVIVHSFFIIPFLITVFCALLFGSIYLLTKENKTAQDYLNDVKIGGLTKRWQAAFELSKILSNKKLLPKKDQFYEELLKAFQDSTHDDPRVRQYLALAMGKTERKEYTEPLISALKEEKEENLPALIYGLGMLKDEGAIEPLSLFMEHTNPKIRSLAAVAIGNTGSSKARNILKKGLTDSEANVQWGSAIGLARMGDDAGREILGKLLTREYLSQFESIDSEEATNLVLAAVEAANHLESQELTQKILRLSQSDKNMTVRSEALNYLSRHPSTP